MTPAVRYLEQHGIKHEVLQYPISRDSHPSDSRNLGEAVAAELQLDPAAVYKTLIVALDARAPSAATAGPLVVALMPVKATLDLKLLSRVAGAKSASMASKASAVRATGYVTGGISPLGQRRQLPTYIAHQACQLERIYVSGGRRGLEIGLTPDDLVRACNAQACTLYQSG